MRCLSIEVTDSFTYVAEVDFRPKRPKLYASLTIETPDGAFADGNISDPELFAKALLPRIREENMKAKAVVFLLSSGRIANRDVIVPQVKPNKIMSLLTANASEYFPVDISTYKLGYNILVPQVSEEEGGGMKLLVIAVPNDLIRSYYKFADALGFKLLALDYIGNAISGMVSPVLPPEPTLTVKLDDTSSIITIFKDRRPILHRSIGYGLADALETISEAKSLNLSDSVDELRSRNYFRGEGDASGFDGPDLREDVETLANGIARVVDYYNSRNKEKIFTLNLTGFGANFKGLAEYIAEITGLETVVMNNFYDIEVTDGLAIGNYVSAIGAALDPIDLTLTDTRGKKKKQTGASIREARKARICYILAAACLLASIVLTAITIFGGLGAKLENSKLQSEKDELMPVVNAYNKYQETLGLHTEVKHIYELTKNRNEELRQFLEELEDIMPSNSYISSFSSDTSGVTLTFTCFSKEEAGNMIERLRSMRSILSVNVTGLSESRDELTGNQSVQFSASLTYKPVEDDMTYEEEVSEEGGQEGYDEEPSEEISEEPSEETVAEEGDE